jgi:DNA polymerase I
MLATEKPLVVKLSAPPYIYAPTYESALEWVLEVWRQEPRELALDIETTGLSPLRDRPVMVQLAHERMPTLLIDARYVVGDSMTALLKDLLESEEWLKILHNAQFDMAFIEHHYGVRVTRHFDTMLAEKLLTMGRVPERNTLADVALKYTGTEMDKSVRLDFTTLGESPLTGAQLRYAARDVEVLPAIMRSQVAGLQEWELVRVMKLELALTQPLIDANLRGVLVDQGKWGEYLEEFRATAEERQRALQSELQPYHEDYQSRLYFSRFSDYKEALAEVQAAKDLRAAEAAEVKQQALDGGAGAGEAQRLMNEWKRENPAPKTPPKPRNLMMEPINLGSGDQLGGALESMGVPMSTKRDTGSYETGKEHLTLLAEDYPICADILEWREVAKLIDAFGENVLALVDQNGRLHPRFNQMVRSGRMSCSEPNIQQIPGGKLGGKLRECFIAPPGYKLLDFDYSNIELRILAHLSNDTGMIRLFHDGLDLHTRTAAAMFGHGYDDMVELLRRADEEPEGLSPQEKGRAKEYKALRKVAKIINFGIPYGQSPAGFARTLNIPFVEADAYVKAYYKANPGVSQWLERNKRLCMARGYTETLFGRKRFFNRAPAPDKEEDPEGYALWKRMQRAMERVANNHPIQGLSADITKIAVVRIWKALAAGGWDARMIMFVHDEIVLECADSCCDEVMEMVEREMKAAAEYFITSVPIEVGKKADVYWSH